MDIRNWELALPDIVFGWEPRALAPDLKSLPREIYIGEKIDVRKQGILFGIP